MSDVEKYIPHRKINELVDKARAGNRISAGYQPLIFNQNIELLRVFDCATIYKVYCQRGSPSSNWLCKNASLSSTPNPGFSVIATRPS